MTIAGPVGQVFAEQFELANDLRDPGMMVELRRIIRKINRMIEGPAAGVSALCPAREEHRQYDPDVLARLAQTIRRLRAERSKFIPCLTSREPDWDILLELYIEKHRARLVPVKAACIASGVPEATAMRRIQLLLEAQLIVRRSDSYDKRRKYLNLTTQGEEQVRMALIHWFKTIRRFYRELGF